MQESRIFDPSSNLDWQEEIEWGQRYIQQFNIKDTTVEDLGELLTAGILKRRTWVSEADDLIDRGWNARHPNNPITTSGRKIIEFDSEFDKNAIHIATVELPAFIYSLGVTTKNEDLIKGILPFMVIGRLASSERKNPK